MKRQQITELVKATVAEFGKAPAEINDGYCDEFACRLQEKFSGFRYEFSTEDDPFNHDWVSYRGFHYDAETPEGVRTRKEIGTKPAFR